MPAPLPNLTDRQLSIAELSLLNAVENGELAADLAMQPLAAGMLADKRALIALGAVIAAESAAKSHFTVAIAVRSAVDAAFASASQQHSPAAGQMAAPDDFVAIAGSLRDEADRAVAAHGLPLRQSTQIVERLPWTTRFGSSRAGGQLFRYGSLAAAVALMVWGGVAASSALTARYKQWQLASKSDSRSPVELTPALTQPTQPELAIAAGPSVRGTDGALPADTTTLEAPAITLAARELSLDALARAGRIMLVVRSPGATSPERLAAAIAKITRRSVDVVRTQNMPSADGAEVVMLAASQADANPALAAAFGRPLPGESPFAGVRAMLDLALGSPDGSSAGFGQSPMPPWAQPVGVRPLVSAAHWLSSQEHQVVAATLHDRPGAVEGIRASLAGRRGIAVTLIVLPEPIGAQWGTVLSAAAKDDALWWTRPSWRWQELMVPVVVTTP